MTPAAGGDTLAARRGVKGPEDRGRGSTMRRSSLAAGSWAALFVLATAWAAGRADDTRTRDAGVPAGLGDRVRAVSDAVLAHHVDPPARQQMILDGLRAVYKAAGRPVPNGLARTVSAVADPARIDA